MACPEDLPPYQVNAGRGRNVRSASKNRAAAGRGIAAAAAGLVMGGIIECPKHNGRFDYTSGQALGAPVLTDVRAYPAKVEAGTVYIEND
jgi:nitrite reductase/ring-hydroxylating ferredoxin subunit